MTVWSDSFLLSTSQATRASSDFCITMENFDVAIIFGLVFCILVIHHDDLNKSAAFITKHLACLYRLLFNAFGHALSASQRFAVQMSTTVKEGIVLPVCHSATELANAVHVHLEELLNMIVLPTYYRATDLVKSGRNYVVGLAITTCDRAVDLLHNINNYFQELRKDDERLHNIFTVLSHAVFASIILSSVYQGFSLSGRLSYGALRMLFAAHLVFSHCMVGFIYNSASVTELIYSRIPSIVDSILEYVSEALTEHWTILTPEDLLETPLSSPTNTRTPTNTIPPSPNDDQLDAGKQTQPVAQNTLHDPLVCFDSSSTFATPAVHATDADDLNRLYGDMELSYGEGIECNYRDNHDDCNDAVLSN
ncbi:hypothetical protein D6D19_09682 [Aureobasidium pullulans]|uniref:Uncharacterized protein n=1 Tax=Aureobasidium pullulans TaxID=5580 RepID=A0A4V4JXP4_AURPU|nr:hypothetical protein D6D19_09682 [Aureobasidium pullulans]THY34053.1 hypothetical protein D6D00_00436 [Aureobasidium pullulans]